MSQELTYYSFAQAAHQGLGTLMSLGEITVG